MGLKTVIQIVYGEKPKIMRQLVLYALYCLAAAIEGSLLLINMISFLMKRNILTSDPALHPSWYTFVLDLISICVLLFLTVQAGFILMGKKPSLYRSFNWQTASKKPWANALNAPPLIRMCWGVSHPKGKAADSSM